MVFRRPADFGVKESQFTNMQQMSEFCSDTCKH
jgi:hypothetical protein